jgi:CheY-like chemotaxis protein
MSSKAAPARVLVVGDEPAIRRLLCASPTAQGYRVKAAGGGSVTAPVEGAAVR